MTRSSSLVTRKGFINYLRKHKRTFFQCSDSRRCALAEYLWSKGVQPDVCHESIHIKRPKQRKKTEIQTPKWAKEFMSSFDVLGGKRSGSTALRLLGV